MYLISILSASIIVFAVIIVLTLLVAVCAILASAGNYDRETRQLFNVDEDDVL